MHMAAVQFQLGLTGTAAGPPAAAATAAAIDLAPLTSAFTAVQNGAVPGVTLEEGEETAEADLIAYVAETLGVEAGSASTARELLISHLSTLLGVDVTDAAYDVIAKDGKLDAADLREGHRHRLHRLQPRALRRPQGGPGRPPAGA